MAEINNINPIDTAPVPKPGTETAEKMRAGIESTEGVTERAQEALIKVIDTLQDHPERIGAFAQALESFGPALENRNKAAKAAKEEMVGKLNGEMPDASLEGTSVDVRIGALVAKLAEGIKAGTIGLDDVEIMFNLARLQDQEERAKAEAYTATGQGAVGRTELPEKK